MDYNKINEIMKCDLEDKDIQFEMSNLGEITKLAYILISNVSGLKEEKVFEKEELSESIRISSEFLRNISPSYLAEFNRLLNEIQFRKSNGENGSLVNREGVITIDYSNTIEDIFTLVHEITHKFSRKENTMLSTNRIMLEITSITMEYILNDYLKQASPYDKDEINKVKNNTLYYAYRNAVHTVLQGIFIHIYKTNNNHIDESKIKDFIKTLEIGSPLRTFFEKEYEKGLNDIIEKDNLYFAIYARYIIGVLFASHLYTHIKEEGFNLDELYKLVSDLKEKDIKEITGLEIFKNGKLNITDEVCDKLKESFIKEQEEILLKGKTSEKNS